MGSMIRWMLLVATHIISHEPATAMGAGPRHVHPWGCSAKSPATWSSRGDGPEHFFKLLEELRTFPDFLNLRRMQPIVFYIFYYIFLMLCFSHLFLVTGCVAHVVLHWGPQVSPMGTCLSVIHGWLHDPKAVRTGFSSSQFANHIRQVTLTQGHEMFLPFLKYSKVGNWIRHWSTCERLMVLFILPCILTYARWHLASQRSATSARKRHPKGTLRRGFHGRWTSSIIQHPSSSSSS